MQKPAIRHRRTKKVQHLNCDCGRHYRYWTTINYHRSPVWNFYDADDEIYMNATRATLRCLHCGVDLVSLVKEKDQL